MARGSTAKIEVENKVAQTFGDNYIGNINGKLYVWANDGGERVQIALTLTCPKTNVEAPSGVAPSTGWDFSEDNRYSSSSEVEQKVNVTVTEEEKKNIEEMMARLGL